MRKHALIGYDKVNMDALKAVRAEYPAMHEFLFTYVGDEGHPYSNALSPHFALISIHLRASTAKGLNINTKV